MTHRKFFRKDNSLFGDDQIHDENLNDFGEGSSRCTLAEVKSGSGQKRLFADVSRKDTLFDDGLSFEEVFHSSREIHEKHVSRSQISADEKRCCNILGRLQKKEDEYLHLVFHDIMISLQNIWQNFMLESENLHLSNQVRIMLNPKYPLWATL